MFCFKLFYIHRLWIFDVDDREAFSLFGRKQAKLNLLDGAQGRARIREIEVRHDCSCYPRETILSLSTIFDDRSACADGCAMWSETTLRPLEPPKTMRTSPAARFTNLLILDPKLPGSCSTRRPGRGDSGARSSRDGWVGMVMMEVDEVVMRWPMNF